MLRLLSSVMISLVIILALSDVQAHSADNNGSVDGYGLYIRNNSNSLPSWYPENTGFFEGFHDSDIPRVVDYAGIISDKDEEELKKRISAYSTELGRDIVVVTDRSAYGLGHEKYCYDFYDFNGYGIGSGYEGMCLFVCMDPGDRGWWVGATGFETRDMYNETRANRLDDELYEYMSKGEYGEGILRWVDNIYVAYCSYTPHDPSTLPSWFPEDANAFESFHDPDRSRVVDFAEILTDEQENELKKKIAEYSKKVEKDIVVVTDLSDYGLGMQRYGTCFFEFNGYGIGKEYEGMCLFVNTGNNNIWSGASGNISSELDDTNKNTLYSETRYSMNGGRFYEGINRWIDMVYAMYNKGFALAPDWYPTLDEKEAFIRSHNADAPKVVDSCMGDGLFSDGQESVLSKKAQELSDKYGADVVIHTADSSCDLGYERYAGDFYYYNGYGSGDDYKAIVLCIFGNFNKISIETYGSIKDELSDVNYRRMFEQSDEAGDSYKAAELFLENYEHWARTGRVSRTFGQWLFAAIISLLIGLFIGKKSLNRARKKMVTVRSAYGADNYISGTSDFSNGTDKFLNRNVQKTKIPRYTSSGSGSSSRSSSSRSHSSYHSSSRGSSGRSHSGSGRRF